MPALDGFRGLALIMVLATHSGPVMPRDYTYWGGIAALDVFFVLSGYLITGLMLRERQDTSTIRMGAFYMRRLLRIAPPLLLSIPLAGLAVWSLGMNRFSTLSYGWSAATVLLYVGNWFQSFVSGGIGVFSHYWSLAIEEQYYILWPMLLAFMLRRGMTMKRIGGGLVVVALASAALRLVVFETRGWEAAFYWTFTRLDGLLLGSALALGLFAQRSWLINLLRSRITASGGLLVLLVCTLLFRNLEDPRIYRGLLLLIGLAAAAVIGHCAVGGTSRVAWAFENRPLRAISRISYAMYLFQPLVVYALLPRIEWYGRKGVVAAVSLAAVLAVASYFLVEKPVLRLKGRFSPGAPKPVPEPLGGVSPEG